MGLEMCDDEIQDQVWICIQDLAEGDISKMKIFDREEIADDFNTYFSSIACKLQCKIDNGFDLMWYLCDRNNRNFFLSPTSQCNVSDIRNFSPKKSVRPYRKCNI